MNMVYEPKTLDELSLIVEGIAKQEIFCSDMVKDEDAHLLPRIFIATAMAGHLFSVFAQHNNIEMLYAPRKYAGPVEVSGYPCFLGCGFLNKQEAEIVRESVPKVLAKIKEHLDQEREQFNKGQEGHREN